MATGVLLTEMMRNLRAEVGQSLLPAHGVNTDDAIKYLLRRAQEALWIEYTWPMLALRKSKSIQAGDRYVAFPTGMTFEQVRRVYVQFGTGWCEMGTPITLEDLSIYDSEAGVTSTPAQKWAYDPDTGGIEIWPISGGVQKLMFVGQKSLNALVADADRSTLDGTLIVLRAAAELALGRKKADADLKIQQVARYAQKLIARQTSNQRAPFIMGGGGPTPAEPRAGIDYIPPVS